MNADYPANPATPGAHPFPGVTQAVPQGPGGPEAAPVQWGAVGPRMQSQPGAGGGPVHPGAPAVPPPSPYAAPGGSTGSANPSAPAQPLAPATSPTTQSAPAAQPAATQPATTHPAATQHAATQHTQTQRASSVQQPASTGQPASSGQPGSSGQPAAANPLAPTVAAPIRRTSLRTGTQPVETSAAPAADPPKKFGFFGKKSEAEAPVTGTTTTTLRRKGGPRKVRAMLVSVDPWSAMKMSFLTSIAAGIALVVAIWVVWGVLNTMGVFTDIQNQVTVLFNQKSETSLLQYFKLSKVMSGAILVAVFNTVIITALGTISALIYNIIGKLVGGVYVTLSDD